MTTGSTNILHSIDDKASAWRKSWVFALTVAFCAICFALIDLIPSVFYRVIRPNDYLVFHTAVEFISIIVAFAVFTVGWYGYKQNSNKQDLVIGVVFLMVGLLDFVHTLSYNGMPDFLSPNSVSKASTYWIAARIVNGFGLLAAAFVTADSRRRWLSPGVLAAAGLTVVAALIVIIAYCPRLLPPMYIPGLGQTPLKIYLEWLVIVAYAAAIYIYGARSRERTSNLTLFQLALLVSLFSELSFTLYSSAYDSYNLLGHVWKVIANYLIFRGLFVSSFERPYNELMAAKDQIQQSFARIGDALAGSPELDSTLQLIAELASDILRSRPAAVMLLRDGNLYIQAETGLHEHKADVSIEHASASMAVSSKQPVVIPDITAIGGYRPTSHYRHADDLPVRSIVAAPIMSGEEVLGVVEVYSPKVGDFSRKEAELLSAFARQAAVAIRNSIDYEQKSTVAEALQRSLLPPAPQVPGLDIAVRYIPADDIARVGGDLYDAFLLDNERLALVIGDVCGHGLRAASLTAMTVYMIKGFLIHGMSPGEALQHANLTLHRSATPEQQSTFVTVFLSVLNLHTRKLEFASAGHHMPLVFRNGGCELPELHSSLPLVIDAASEYGTYTLDLSDATGLLLYTDGVIEARRRGELFGEDRVSELCVQTMNLPSDEVLDRIVEQTRAWSGILKDDIALLALKYR